MSEGMATRKGAGEPPIVLYENARKMFGQFVALNGVSAQVNKGEVMCLIGPSGSGKSTLLRCTNGLEKIDGGRIVFEGEPLPSDERAMRIIRRRMGWCSRISSCFHIRQRWATWRSGRRLCSA